MARLALRDEEQVEPGVDMDGAGGGRGAGDLGAGGVTAVIDLGAAGAGGDVGSAGAGGAVGNGPDYLSAVGLALDEVKISATLSSDEIAVGFDLERTGAEAAGVLMVVLERIGEVGPISSGQANFETHPCDGAHPPADPI